MNAEGKNQLLPRARTERLVVCELADEVLIYDLERDRAHCLNQTAALVWKQCDGRTSVPEIARRLEQSLGAPVAEPIVWLALNQLGRRHLLQERLTQPVGMASLSRRKLIKMIGLTAAVALPLITSIVAPTAVQAASCLQAMKACTASAQCCSGICASNVCQ